MIRERVEQLLMNEPKWAYFFETCCATGADRLRAQAWQFRDELEERSGVRFRVSGVEDALLSLSLELLPDSLAGREDHRALLFREAVAWLHERGGYEVVVAALGDPDLVNEAFEELTLSEFRAFLRQRMRATSRAVAS